MGLTFPFRNGNIIASGERSPLYLRPMTSLSYGPFISRKQAQEQGLKQYFTGKPCKHGHTHARLVSSRSCLLCACERVKAAYKPAAKAALRICACCQKEFQPQRNQSQAKFCSSKCQRSVYRQDHKEQTNARQNEIYSQMTSAERTKRNLKMSAVHKLKMATCPKFAEKTRAYHRNWKRQNPEKCRQSERCSEAKLYKTSRNFQLKKVLRNRVASALRAHQAGKGRHTESLIGCSVQQLAEHLEALFQPGMSWDDYGLYGWHIDHIRPCASFDLTDEAQQRECFHYTNLQPLWAADNIRKSDKWEPQLQAA